MNLTVLSWKFITQKWTINHDRVFTKGKTVIQLYEWYELNYKCSFKVYFLLPKVCVASTHMRNLGAFLGLFHNDVIISYPLPRS